MTRELSIRGVAKRWGDDRVLAQIDLAVDAGEIVAVLGRSGTGKSTLLRIVAGLETADAGEVYIGGVDVTQLRPGERRVGMVFQHSPVLTHLAVRENIGFGISRRRRLTGDDASRVADAASLVGCEHLLDRRPGALSGGERQRVALARALVRTPDLVLLDEPLSSLDVHDRVELRTALRDALVRSGSTGLHVTHDQAEAFAVGDRVAVIDGGVVQQIGTADDLYERPATLAVARLVGSPRINLLEVAGGAAGPFALAREVIDGKTIGVRPSAMSPVPVDSAGAVRALVHSVEIADELAVVGVVVGVVVGGDASRDAGGDASTGVTEIRLTLTTPRTQRPQVGDIIGLAPRIDRFVTFDPPTDPR